MIRTVMLLIGVLLNFFAFSQINSAEVRKISYVPLGDSYTICEGAKASECWTELLSLSLYKRGLQLDILANPARSGFTTKDLIERQLPLFENYKPQFTTLLIGVNDWVQEVNPEEFRKNYIQILNRVQQIIEDKDNILILTIPDFSVKPEGKKYGKGRNISEGLAYFNKIISEEADKRGLKVVDLYSLSHEMKYDKQTIAADGLHPSAKEYALWEKVIFQSALEILEDKE
jgi:acyl-CoA thioesterase I